MGKGVRVGGVDWQRTTSCACVQLEKECANTKAELLSRLLGVASGACNSLDAEVRLSCFVAAREALHSLKEALKTEYMESIIPY